MDYSRLFPRYSETERREGVSRETTLTLAQTYVNRYTFQYDEAAPTQVRHAELYDFLYENGYPLWFVKDSQRHLDARSLQLWIMHLHTGETIGELYPKLDSTQLQELGQAYLIKLAEDVIRGYTEELEEVYGPVEWGEYPEYIRPLLRRLELDSFVFRDNRLLKSETNVLAEEEEQSLLESLYQSTHLGKYETTFHHLKLSEEHYLAERWDDSISNSRKFLENVLREVAAAYSLHHDGAPLSQHRYERAAEVRKYLEDQGLINTKEKETLAKVYGLLSDTGGHPHMARSDQARLLRNLALTLSQFVMLRFQGSDSSDK